MSPMPERDYPALLRSLADGSPPADGGDYATEAERAALLAHLAPPEPGAG